MVIIVSLGGEQGSLGCSGKSCHEVQYRPLRVAKMVQEKLILTEEQLQALERAKNEKEAGGEIGTEPLEYLGAQDTFCVGTLKEVGRIMPGYLNPHAT